MENLSEFDFYEGDPDPGAVYRNLRQMEGEELVESSWDNTGSGPAKRLYRLTPKGEDYLHSWVASIRKRKEAFEKFLSIYKNLFKKD
jgi:poly-beta-hydroxybutyrate-responsive repressor